MKVRISTLNLNSEFDLPKEKVLDLLTMAMQYGMGYEDKNETSDGILNDTETAAEVSPSKSIPEPLHAQDIDYSPLPVIPSSHNPIIEERVKMRMIGFSGFMIIECECGHSKTFFARNSINSFVCEECGKRTELHHMINAYSECKCGSKLRYKTNSQKKIISANCIRCKAPVDMEYNEKLKFYNTMKEKPQHH